MPSSSDFDKRLKYHKAKCGTTPALFYPRDLLTSHQEYFMLRAAITFFVLGLVAMLFGAYGIAGVSIELGKVLLMVFIVLAILSFVVGLIRGNGSNRIP